MTHTIIILTVGKDPILLETRNRVLRSAGYTVVSVMSIGEAMAKFLYGDFDLVLLCHTISKEDKERLAKVIRARGAQTPIVSVEDGTGVSGDGVADKILPKDPSRLLDGLHELLERNGESILRESSGQAQ